MDPKRPAERHVFDFATNSWVLADAFNARAEGREIALPTPVGEPAPGRWNRPAPKAKAVPAATLALAWLAVALLVAAIVRQTFVLFLSSAVCGALAAVFMARGSLDDVSITEADLMLLEDPDDPDVCLVRMTVVRDGRVVGEDKGVVWFADGLLLYNGHRTSFAVGGEDVLPHERWGGVKTVMDGGYLTENSVPLRVERGSAYVRLHPLIQNGPSEMRFLKRLYAFRRRPPLSRGPRQWPPFE